VQPATHERRPLVSVTSAFYNTAPFLLDMIKSILAQTFEDWELVLLDDGSTDDSLAIARSVDDPRIRVFSNGHNLGRSASLNKLTELARGKYIARMDSDDMSRPTRIEKQVAYLEQHPEADVLGTAFVYIDRDNRPMGHSVTACSHEEICKEPMRTFGILHPSILVRREWLERFKYDESFPLSVDTDLFLRSYGHSRFANLAEPLFYYRLETSFRLGKQLTARRTMARCLFAHCRESGRSGQAIWHAGIQYVKFAITAAMFGLGMRERLMSRRFTPLSAEQEAFYTDELETIHRL
jgi:glycosyltransferase involved in cell wall biosynthesis